MEKQEFSARYETYRMAVEDYLQGLFHAQPHWKDLYDSMRYSLLAGGKRIRPVLTLEFARLSGLQWQQALPVACALELVHTYSLIHDDLPCMDDDDLRRGKPTNHKVYGETLAVLAGDALQPEAYRLILETPSLDASCRANCALILAKASGADGMVGGQVLDTLHTPSGREELTEVHRLKTGAMIAGACALGVAAANGGDELMNAAERYAYELGMAFQIRDDMLDVVGDAAVFGKPIGSDVQEGKETFVDLLGLQGCNQAVLACTARAKDAVERYDTDGFLRAFADTLAERVR